VIAAFIARRGRESASIAFTKQLRRVRGEQCQNHHEAHKSQFMVRTVTADEIHNSHLQPEIKRLAQLM
jgi:hypothetical protein